MKQTRARSSKEAVTVPRSPLPLPIAAAVSATLFASCGRPPQGEPPQSTRAIPRAQLEQLVSKTLPAVAPTALRPVSAFAAIDEPQMRSAALFLEMGRVITHPRCMNCHPAGDAPLQGELGIAHTPPVTRGDDGHGVAGLECATCHDVGHTVFADGINSLPGNPRWALAPAEMAWVGQALGDICRQVSDPERNGGLSLDQLVVHNAEDPLVAYGWDPGPGRAPAPGTQAEFGALTRAWVDTGAVCPTEPPAQP